MKIMNLTEVIDIDEAEDKASILNIFQLLQTNPCLDGDESNQCVE